MAFFNDIGELGLAFDHVVKEGHVMNTIGETMSIIHLENKHRKINLLEEIKILKAASSRYLLNDIVTG